MFSGRSLVPQEKSRPSEETGRGRLVRVYVHNDDITPMDFVVHVLIAIFLLESPQAEYVMYTAHRTGKAYVQTLPAALARRRIGQARFAARLRGLPLNFSMEAE